MLRAFVTGGLHGDDIFLYQPDLSLPSPLCYMLTLDSTQNHWIQHKAIGFCFISHGHSGAAEVTTARACSYSLKHRYLPHPMDDSSRGREVAVLKFAQTSIAILGLTISTESYGHGASKCYRKSELEGRSTKLETT
jgi:hypothetical protein